MWGHTACAWNGWADTQVRPYGQKRTVCVARDDLGARCPAEGTREARRINKSAQQ